jgi:hypothetical protein
LVSGSWQTALMVMRVKAAKTVQATAIQMVMGVAIHSGRVEAGGNASTGDNGKGDALGDKEGRGDSDGDRDVSEMGER